LNINTRLYSYGYSKRTENDLYPYCDTLYTVGDSVFNNTDKYIFVYNPGDMHGSSGSPVYYKKNNKYHLVGVYFASIPPEWSFSYPEIFYRNKYNNTVGLIVTINYLRESLNLILKE
ncbi:MAG TPA: hypothetical protein VGQ04_17565, partial [Chitinophagaceae bacterium]|nr:hypothetical protein [Chitinophagaceae bacterium]